MADDEEIDQHIEERFEILQKLGKGAYGVVWKVKERDNTETLALKKIFGVRSHRCVCYVLNRRRFRMLLTHNVPFARSLSCRN